MKKASKTITYILIILLLVGAIAVFFKFTNGGTTGFKTFYVEANGKTYLGGEKMPLPQGETRFETKYLFSDNRSDKHKGYTLKVVPNITEDTKFYFSVDGDDIPYPFEYEKDLTKGFDIKMDETGFTVTNNNMTMESVLSKAYDGKAVKIADYGVDYTKVYFNLVVSSYNGEKDIVIGLLFNVPSTGIKLNTNGIIF